ncbi:MULTISPECIES: hypothetical protein [Bacillus]|uniref:hypothetical protein n=1 Tax=Bacillus TaxID=1386 RepID=UPI00227EF16C|nr:MULTISPECIES: hypothetical protein [Bacillus subtilis group]MCY8110093.1 hypothetical protein [Bacillus spizizenii]MCY9348337.1 hypothetical protein [Bacillus spizizenii]MDP0485137.1 hypothetical protein [Bacillus subtilis]MEC1600724.1 hypothetical protein [Bacillus halotolerans]
MGVYDNDVIMSWTPNEYKRKLKAAKLREIDEMEKLARNAMFHRYALNEKRPKESKMFDARKARRELERSLTSEENKWRESDINKLGSRAKGVQMLNDAVRSYFGKQYKEKG